MVRVVQCQCAPMLPMLLENFFRACKTAASLTVRKHSTTVSCGIVNGTGMVSVSPSSLRLPNLASGHVPADGVAEHPLTHNSGPCGYQQQTDNIKNNNNNNNNNNKQDTTNKKQQTTNNNKQQTTNQQQQTRNSK